MASAVSYCASISAVTLLGGEVLLASQPRSARDWIPLARRGLPAAAIDSMVRLSRIAQTEFAKALDIPERTMARRKREGVFSSDESAKLIRFARVAERAEEVFEDQELAFNWIKTANTSLDGFMPLSLLDTELGAETVLDTLGRIEHGVFA